MLAPAQYSVNESLFRPTAALAPIATQGSTLGWNSITNFTLASPSSVPIAITRGPDGALWFTDNSTTFPGKIGRIDTHGVTTEYALNLGSLCCGGFDAITTGPDGAVWFGEFNGIGRISTAGAVTEYIQSGCCIFPQSITSGPDGALWFTDTSNGRIGRITTAGVLTQFPAQLFGPYGIAAGSDGALWFTESGSSRIGRITTSGVVTEYPLPTAGSPQGITAGPDGALWFTEFGAGKIGRITTGGVITEYSLTAPNSGPNAITTGPDRALWFTESNANKIGRITTTGFITEYAPPLAGSPVGITAGPDGGLWFTQPNSNSIGRAWACGLGLNLGFANTTLDIGFNLGVAVPATFGTALATGQGVKQLWSRSVTAIAPPAAFTVPVGPGFPNVGNVVVLSSLSVPTTGLICFEWQTVSTGGTGPSLAELHQLILNSGIVHALP